MMEAKSPIQKHWHGRASGLLCVITSLLLIPPAIARQLNPQSQQQDDLQHVRSLLAAGLLANAEAELRPILLAHPSADAHFLMGYVYYRRQKATESLAEYTAGAQERRPGAYELKIVAEDYILLQDYTDADKWLTEVTKQTPEDADAWYLLGRTKYNENSFADAAACFEHALTLRPKDVVSEDNLGLSQQGFGESDKAKASYRNAIAWQGPEAKQASPFLNLGSLLLEQGSAQEALPYLRKAAELAPENPTAHEDLAGAYEELKMLADASAELEAAAKLAPEATSLHFKLGRVYKRLGNTQAAEREYAIAAKLNSTHSSKATPNPPSAHP
jgi:tetratricopeptide (TPR) repeat protein